LLAKKKTGLTGSKRKSKGFSQNSVDQDQKEKAAGEANPATTSTLEKNEQMSSSVQPASEVEDFSSTTENEVSVQVEKEKANFEPLETLSALKTRPNKVQSLQMEVEASKGKYRVDFETGQPIKLAINPREKYAQCFPEAPVEVCTKYRIPVTADYKMLCVTLDDAISGGNDTLKAYVLANRDLMGMRARKVLTSLKLQAQSNFDKNLAQYYNGLRYNLIFRENCLMGPFRQLMYEAEQRVAPWMGSYEVERFAGKDMVDYAGTWLVLKAAVAEWERRRYTVAKQVTLLEEDGKLQPYQLRSMRNELQTAAYMTNTIQQMSLALADKKTIFEELPLEMQFLEKTLSLNTTTEVRKFASTEFCPEKRITMGDLIRKLRALLVSIEFLSQKTYRNIYSAIEESLNCLTEGTPESFDPYMAGYKDIRFDTYKITTSPDFNAFAQGIQRDDDLEQDFSIIYDAIKQTFGIPVSNKLLDNRPKDLGWINLLDDDFEETKGVEVTVRDQVIQRNKEKGQPTK